MSGTISSSVPTLTFTGTSQYASDFQSILTRSVAIASLPLQSLQNTDTTVLGKQTQLGTLQGAVSSLVTSLQSLGTIGSSQALGATSSNASVVSFTATGATTPQSYTVNSVTSLAAAASETTTSGFANSQSTPVSATGNLSLVFGGTSYPIALTAQTNNLVGLQNAINGLGLGLTASILTTGTGANPNFLSVSASNTGQTTLQLNDDPGGANTNLLTSLNQGTNASFSLNGLPVTRSGNTVNDLIPGGTLTLTGKSTSPTTLSFISDPSQLSSGLQSLVTAYNSAVDQVNGQKGKGAGLLQGDSIVFQLQAGLRSLTSYQGSGSVKSLADVGIELQSTGKMKFNSTTFNSLTSSQLQDAFKFVGSATTGLAGVSQALLGVSDPITGSIAQEQTSLTTQDQTLQNQIAVLTATINANQSTLFSQLSVADSLISSLAQQQSALTATLQSLTYVSYGNQSSSSSSNHNQTKA